MLAAVARRLLPDASSPGGESGRTGARGGQAGGPEGAVSPFGFWRRMYIRRKFDCRPCAFGSGQLLLCHPTGNNLIPGFW